jgi:DNA-binding NarL/FixJ family response regulator
VLGDRIKLALLDDHPVALAGLREYFGKHQEIEVLGAFLESRLLLEFLSYTPADVVLMDFHLGRGDRDGAEVILDIRRMPASPKVVVLSASDSLLSTRVSIGAGAFAHISKREHLSAALEATKDAAKRSSLPVRRRTSMDGDIGSIGHALDSLTSAECEVLRLVLKGLKTGGIASLTGRAVSTISAQKWAAFRKLGVTSEMELFRLLPLGWLEGGNELN